MHKSTSSTQDGKKQAKLLVTPSPISDAEESGNNNKCTPSPPYSQYRSNKPPILLSNNQGREVEDRLSRYTNRHLLTDRREKYRISRIG